MIGSIGIAIDEQPTCFRFDGNCADLSASKCPFRRLEDDILLVMIQVVCHDRAWRSHHIFNSIKPDLHDRGHRMITHPGVEHDVLSLNHLREQARCFRCRVLWPNNAVFRPSLEVLTGRQSNPYTLSALGAADGGVIEKIGVVDLGHPWIFTAKPLLVLLIGNDQRFGKSLKVDAIRAFRIANRRNIPARLVPVNVIGRTVNHPKSAAIVKDIRVQNRSRFPGVFRIPG